MANERYKNTALTGGMTRIMIKVIKDGYVL
ncbi:hypothetical protein SAMN04487928_13927 [Butyrivibrio proteoclasticus]|uniref:Uncharacterized protein n=1 Tax=Butyrivibrio proteoclasticus TaxID=43305 RepID=A0A1I5Y0L6_9FIRM|nr:hypothetical protein SAMN04487928_13927 [Butyrivibrio proteoclasticus]